jgi:2-polyprenyl-6-methoxyphenol hydroxylase-like FAD-dependent oxidoreductase
MSPFAGEGENLALYDGAELGKAPAENSGEVEAALTALEQNMFTRTAPLESARNLALFINENSSRSVVELSTHYQSMTLLGRCRVS